MEIGPGEMFIAPKGKEHKPCATGEIKVLLIEPRGLRTPATKAATAPRQMMYGSEHRLHDAFRPLRKGQYCAAPA